MASGWRYRRQFTIAAAMDIFELECTPTFQAPIEIVSFDLSLAANDNLPVEQILTLSLKRVTGSPVSGSGGGSASKEPLSPNDSFDEFPLVEIGNTTKLSGGTSAELARFAWPIRSPLRFAPDRVGRPVFTAATFAALELLAAPTVALTVELLLLIRELGGRADV